MSDAQKQEGAAEEEGDAASTAGSWPRPHRRELREISVRAPEEAHVVPHLPIMNTRREHDSGIYPIAHFQFDPGSNRFICPQGSLLRYWGVHPHSKQHVYRASATDCRQGSVKAECTRSTYRSVSVHIYEAALARARALTKTPEYRISQRMRKRVEELFREAKEYRGCGGRNSAGRFTCRSRCCSWQRPRTSSGW